MKKTYIICVLCSVFSILNAAQRTVWEGNKAISWNQDVYAGEQFETPDGTFTGLLKDDTIKVTVIAQIDEPQYVMTYKAGTGWEWTDLAVTLEEGVMSYVVESEQIATEIAERGLVFRGQGYDMTKIVVASKDTLPDPVDPDPEVPDTLQPGETKVLWEGEETLSWNEIAEQDSLVGALLAEKDQIIVTVSAKGTAEWPKVLLRDTTSTQVGNDILLNEVTEFPYEAVFTLTAIDVETLKGGFKLCGDGVTVTKMVLKKYKEEDPGPGPEPQPQDTIPYEYAVVWTGDKAISWNTEVYAGEQFDTYAVQQDMMAGLAKDDSIKVFYKDAIDGAQLRLQYKDGDNWDQWKELAVTEKAEFFAYKVESEELAQLIADRGLVVTGQGYHATRIEIGKPKNEPQGIESIQSSEINSQKIFRNGQILIIREDGIYSILGQKIQ